MDKKKSNARQARYRSTRARLELMVTEELREQFRALPGTESMTNAEKLEALCNLWQDTYAAENDDAQPFDEPPISSDDAQVLNDALKSLEALETALSLEAFKESGLAENKEKLRFYLNKASRVLYDNSKYKAEAKSGGKHPRTREVIEGSEAVSAINAFYGGGVAGAIALKLVNIDLSFWHSMTEEQRRFALWAAFTAEDW